MIAAPMRLSDQLSYELVAAFAREAGKPAPKTIRQAAQFLKEELKGFDTPEANERRERAVANELLALLGAKKRMEAACLYALSRMSEATHLE